MFLVNALISGKILLYNNESIIQSFNDLDNLMELFSNYLDFNLTLVLQEKNEEIFNDFQENFVLQRKNFTIKLYIIIQTMSQ